MTLLVVLALAAACSDDEGAPPPATDVATTEPTASAVPTTAPPTSSPTTTAAPPTTSAPTTTLAPVPSLPAGMQFDDGTEIPISPSATFFDGDQWALAGAVDNGQQLCADLGNPNCLRIQADPVVHLGNPSSGFTSVTVDHVASIAAPPGTEVASSLRPVSIAHSSLGWVIAGVANFIDPLASHTRNLGVLWFSTDGSTWQRTDLRDLVGDQTTVLTSVTATEAGFVAVGSIGNADHTGPARGLVVRSADGVTWTVTELALAYSTALGEVMQLGDGLVVRGAEYPCTFDSFGLVTFFLGGQERAWRSDDGGATFAPVDLAASQVFTVSTPSPADPAACADLGLSGAAGFTAAAGRMQVVGDRLFLFSADGATVASTADLASWTAPATLGYVATPPAFPLVAADGDGYTIVRLQRPAHGSTTFAFGVQALGWIAGPDALTWTETEGVAPVLSIEPGPLFTSAAGKVVLFQSTMAADGSASSRVLTSTAGPLVEPPACELVAGASCPLATISGQDLSGLDLTGIDLIGATIVDSDLTGTNLTGAKLQQSVISGGGFSGALLVGADLREADLRDADLTGADLSGADLTGGLASLSLLSGVTLTGAALVVDFFLDATSVVPPGISVAGLNLSGATFSNFDDVQVDLHGLDWTGAILIGTQFYGIDLTGSNFTSADLRSADFGQNTNLTGAITTGANIGATANGLLEQVPSFSDTSVCPDGGPPTLPGTYQWNQCRFAV